MEVLTVISKTDLERERYEARVRFERDQRSNLNEARQEGHAKGLQEGLAEDRERHRERHRERRSHWPNPPLPAPAKNAVDARG